MGGGIPYGGMGGMVHVLYYYHDTANVYAVQDIRNHYILICQYMFDHRLIYLVLLDTKQQIF